MSDPIEAAARAIYHARFDKATGVVKNSFLEVARAAIDVYHAAQPSDYAELKRDARARDDETSDKLVDAIENLEAERDALKARVVKDAESSDRIDACLTTMINDIFLLLKQTEAERDELKARVSDDG